MTPDIGDDVRQRLERNRAESRRRYRELIAEVISASDGEEPDEVADAVLDAMTPRIADTGEVCRCSCHPQLPSSDFHDLGFDCTCSYTPEQRREKSEQLRAGRQEFLDSPAGRRVAEAREREEAALQKWLADQPGVVIAEHGGMYPEQWSGTVDGHSFYFRERSGEWRLELDLRPTGRFVDVISGVDENTDEVHSAPREIEEGDIIAAGVVDSPGYGTTPVERAQFLVDTIRTHLTRRACRLHEGGLADVAALVGAPVRWCPACGAKLY